MESHGQRRRCPRGAPRGHPGAWCHGMRGGWCGPWGMRGAGRGRFGCTLRGHGVPPPPPRCRPEPCAAATAATAQQPQPMDNSDTQANRRHDGDTNAETGEMAEAAATVTDHGWTLVNGGMADVEGARTGVEQLHVAADSAVAEDHTTEPAIPGTSIRVQLYLVVNCYRHRRESDRRLPGEYVAGSGTEDIRSCGLT